MALRRSVIGLLFFSSLIGAQPQSAPRAGRADALQAPDVYRKVAPSVVSIAVSGRDGKPIKAGSGVVIDTAGHVLTNYHVVEGGVFFDVSVSDAGGKVRAFSARPAACAPEHDLAELELGSPSGLRAARKATGEPDIGSRVYAVGSPLQLEGTLTEGVVSQFRRLGEQKLIQMTAAISSGSSGGGLFNSRGELVGITTLSISEGQNLNFAVSLAGSRALTRCDEFPVLIGKAEPTSTPTPPSPPKPLPCHKPPFKYSPQTFSSDGSYFGRDAQFTITAWITNTGCQKVRDIELKVEIYYSDTKKTIEVLSAHADEWELEVGERSFVKVTGSLQVDSGNYSYRWISIKYSSVDPATGRSLPAVYNRDR